MVRLGQFFFRYRNVVGPAILVVVILFATPQHLMGDRDADGWMDLAGALVVVLGLAVRAATIGYEYIVRGGRNRQVYADRLVQGGLYAHTRNPMYLGNALIALGMVVIVNAPLVYFLAVPLIAFVYATIIAAEEAYLRERFGAEFDAYCARVPRLLPRLSGLRASLEGMRFNWRRVLVKDYSTIFLSILFVLVLSVLDDVLITGPEAMPALELELAILVPWALLYLIVWRLKKTRRLEGDRPEPGSAA